MRVLLLQLDGALPNLALMRLAAFHRSCGDLVTLRQLRRKPATSDVERHLWDAYDRVYASLIFAKTLPVAEQLQRVYPGAVLGGTGWDLSVTLAGIGIPEATRPDYADYPGFTASMGFTQRGCRLNCSFCLVPETEGSIRDVAAVHDIRRGEPYPRHLVLLDNDFFGQPNWRGKINAIRDGGFRVNFTQGINARMISDEAAEAIASVDYFDTDFRARRLYTAWDNKGDEAVLFRGLNRLVKAGVKPARITVYILIAYWAGETEEDWLYRVKRLRDFGCDPYPMPYRRDSITRGFQRWVLGHYDRRISWAEFRAAECEPRNLKSRGRMALPLFDGIV